MKVESRSGDRQYDLTTPGSLPLRRSHKYDVTFSKPGYQQTVRGISRRLNLLYVLDYIYYIIPGIIDSITGSGWILEPSHIEVTLERTDEVSPANTTETALPLLTVKRKISIDTESYPHRNSTAAILTFDARTGVSVDEVALLADRFAVELGRLEVYKLISRSKMQEVLELQKYSVTCSSLECAVEAGQLLGVEYMIYGSIGHVGTLYTVNVYLTSVEKGEVIASETVDHGGGIEGLLTDGMSQAASKLLQKVMGGRE